MKKILVPIDFSEISIRALKVAVEIAKKHKDSVLSIVHVYEKPVYGVSLGFGIDTKKLREIRQELVKEMELLTQKSFLKGIHLNTHIIADVDVADIINYKNIPSQDLVVMGSHGAKGMKELFIGSNTEKFIRMSTTPVLTIKPSKNKPSFKSVVFASNFSKESEKGFQKIKTFIEAFNMHIHLLKVITPVNFENTNDSIKSMENFAKNVGIKKCTYHVFNSMSVESGVLEFSSEKKIDLIALETHGRTGVSYLINGSIAGDIVNHSNGPVLTVRMSK